MNDFRVSTPPVTRRQAGQYADQLEREIGEIANGQRKAGRLDLESIARLITFARNDARTGLQLAEEIQEMLTKCDQPLHDEQFVALTGYLAARGITA